MDQATEVTPGDDQSEQLAAYIARYLKRGVALDTIQKGLQHNDWDEQTFDRAVTAARELIEAEAQAKAAAEAEEAAKRERAKRTKKRKRTEHKEDHKERAERKKDHDEDAEDDEGESSAGAASFSQDEAVLLHEPPKPKQENDRDIIKETDEDIEPSTGLSDLAAGAEIPLSRTASHRETNDATPATSDEDTAELLQQLDNLAAEEPASAPDNQLRSYPAMQQSNGPYPTPWQQPMTNPYPYGYPYPPASGWQPGPPQNGSAMPAGFYPPNQPGAYPANPYAYPYPMPGQPWPPMPYGYGNQNPYPNAAWGQAGYPAYPPAGSAVVYGTGLAPNPVLPQSSHRATLGRSAAATAAAAGIQPNSHYSLLQALKDGYQAAANNIVNYALSVVLSGLAAGAMFTIVLVAIHKLFSLKYNVLLVAPRRIFVAAFGSLAMYAIFYILAATLVITLTSLALSDGGLKRKRPIGALIMRSIAVSGRVSSALIVTGAIILLPAALIVIIPILICTTVHALSLMATLLPFLYGAALLWVLMTSMRYILTPYVALFGREARLSRMLSRSHELLRGNGQWVVAQIVLGLAVTALGISLSTNHGWRNAVSTDNPLLLIVIALLLLVANGILAMLYRNQKLTKGRS